MPPTWKFQMKLEYNERPASVYPFHGTFLFWKAKLFFHMSQFFSTFFLFVNFIWKFQMKLEYNEHPANVYPFNGTFLHWKAKLFFHMSPFFPTFFQFVNSGLLLATKRCCILSLPVTFSTFWLRQELKESQCPSVHSSVLFFVHSFVRSSVRLVQTCLELSFYIFLAQIFKQTDSNQ